MSSTQLLQTTLLKQMMPLSISMICYARNESLWKSFMLIFLLAILRFRILFLQLSTNSKKIWRLRSKSWTNLHIVPLKWKLSQLSSSRHKRKWMIIGLSEPTLKVMSVMSTLCSLTSSKPMTLSWPSPSEGILLINFALQLLCWTELRVFRRLLSFQNKGEIRHIKHG